jgi:hypothetical protein
MVLHVSLQIVGVLVVLGIVNLPTVSITDRRRNLAFSRQSAECGCRYGV